VTPTRPPLWKCPKCGHRFVTRNLWHSCVRVPLARHFQGRDPRLRRLFDAYRAFVRRCGPFTVYAQRTRIVFMTRARFTGAVVGKHTLRSALWLKRRAAHSIFDRVEHIGRNDWVHYFRIEDTSQFDARFLALVREAYAVGRQDGIRAPARGRRS
jgi:hypothetical protein